MNGGGRLVLIWGRTCRTMLGDKGKPLSGDKDTRTDNNSQNTQQKGMTHVRTNVYAYGMNCERIRVWTELKCVLYVQ